MLVIQLTGSMHSGKTYCANKIHEHLSAQGLAVLDIPFARELKSILKNCFGITKFRLSPIKEESLQRLRAMGEKFIYTKAWEDFDRMGYSRMIGMRASSEEWVVIKTKFIETVAKIYMNEVPEDYTKYSRLLMQWLGTEIGRNFVTEDIWVDIVDNAIRVASSNRIADVVTIGDWRFPNEALDFSDHDNVNVMKIRITASDETRSRRGKKTLEQLAKFAEHDSERFIPDLKVDYEFHNEDGAELMPLLREVQNWIEMS